MLGGVGADCPDPGDLFGEGEGRVVISAEPGGLDALRALAGDLPLREIGATGGERIRVGAAEIGLAQATALWESAIPGAMGEDPEVSA